MFGRKRPELNEKPGEKKTQESERITSYRLDNDAAPAITGALKTTSYVNAMQTNRRGYETLN